MRDKISLRVIATFIVLAALLTYVPAGWGATETVLYSFKDLDDGSGPEGVIRLNGRLYGTTGGGGIYQNGTIFELAHEKSGWVKKHALQVHREGRRGEPGSWPGCGRGGKSIWSFERGCAPVRGGL